MMGNRSIQPSGSPTGAPGSRLTSEETKQSDRAKNQLRGPVLGLGISSSSHDGKQGSRSPAGRAIDTPDDEMQQSRRYSPKGPGGHDRPDGSQVRDDTGRKRQKKKAKKDGKIFIHQEGKSDSVGRRKTGTTNFWERTDSYDEEIGHLFDDVPEISNASKQQQDTGPGFHDKRQQSKSPKVMKKSQRARNAKFGAKGNKNETAHPELIDKFHGAAASGNMDEVRQMLLEGIDVSVTDPEKNDVTALHLAAKTGGEAVVRILLHFGADIDCADGGGKTPLYWAAKQGNASTVEYLLQMNAGRDIRTVTGWTPLHTAARDGSDEVLTVLLSYGFQVEARSNDGYTPLFLAVREEHRSSAFLLLQAGANPKLKTHAGDSPIQEAISRYNTEMLKDMLIALVPGLEDETYEEMMFCLGTESDEFQNSTLLSAIEDAEDDLLRLFLALGVDEENLNEEGHNLLHSAVIYGHESTVHVILEHGANTETRTADGATALLLAARCNQPEVAAVLLDNNANIEAKMPRTGQTALHIAANLASSPACDVENAKRLVRTLLSGGFYFGVTDNAGDTPLALARRIEDQTRAATDILLNPPAVKGRSGYAQLMPPASNITSDEKRVCKAFDAFLVDFYRREKEPPADPTFKGSPGRRSRRTGHIHTQKNKEADVLFDRVDWLPRIKSVHEVTHSFGPKKIMEEAASSMRLGSKHLFRWIHVPANNIAWVKDLVHKICSEKGSSKHHFDDMANFVSKTGSEHWGAMAHSRYMKTCFTVQGANAPGMNDTKTRYNHENEVEEYMDTKLAIYMPFLNFDTTASRKEIAAIVKDFESGGKGNCSATLEKPQKPNISRRKTANGFTRDKKDVTKVFENALRPSEQVTRKFSESDTFNLAREGGYIYALNGDKLPTTDPAAYADENDKSKKPLGHQEKYRVLLREYLSHRHGSLHISRTLDQFYYNSIGTDGTNNRDQDQVVYRFVQGKRSPGVIKAAVAGSEDSVSPSDQATGEKTKEKAPMEYKDNPRIFTVDQMWIWIIDEETIISSFPQRWEEEASQEPKVLETIQAHLTEKNRPQVKSVYEMAAMITSYCIRFADKCSIKGIAANGKEFEESFLQVYASSVSNEADREANLFKKFQGQISVARNEALARVTTDASGSGKLSRSDQDEKVAAHDLFASKEYRLRHPVEQTTELPDSFNAFSRDEAKFKNTSSTGSKTDIPSESPDNPSSESLDLLPGEPADMDKHHYERKLEQKSDISGEIKVLKEIKDIRDELNILHRILTEQKSVTDKLFSPSNRLKMNPDVQEYYLEQSGLERRIQDVEKMDKDAERTYTHVNNLLDLKQKQANIDEALAGAQQGEIAVKQGTVAARHMIVASRQGAVVLIFTLVTIIFLPMTFLTSLYALNISAFPHDDKGDLAYPSAYLFSRLFGISTAIACILLTLAFQVHNIHNFFSEKTKAFDAWNAKRKAANVKLSSSSTAAAAVTRRKSARYDEDGYERDSFEERRERRPSGVRVVERLADGEVLGSPESKQKMRVGWAGVEGNGNGNRVVMGNEVDEEEMEKNQNLRTGNAMMDWTRRVMGKKKVGDVEARVESSNSHVNSSSNASPKGGGLNGEFSFLSPAKGR